MSPRGWTDLKSHTQSFMFPAFPSDEGLSCAGLASDFKALDFDFDDANAHYAFSSAVDGGRCSEFIRAWPRALNLQLRRS